MKRLQSIPVTVVAGTRPTLQESRPACRECQDHWCCTAVSGFSSPAITEEDRRRIAAHTGSDDFYEQRPDGKHLKTKQNGYCTFFNDSNGHCNIYPVRPFDCQIYPFDFLTRADGGWWIMYDCPYSRTMHESSIEQSLLGMEEYYADALEELWYTDDVDDKPDAPYRLLRKVNVRPPRPTSS